MSHAAVQTRHLPLLPRPAAPRFACALLAVLLMTTALAAPAVATAPLSPQKMVATEQPAVPADHPDVKAAEDYLNALKTLKARFIQTDNNGGRLTGVFTLKRPGRMRFQYDAPMTDFIVADGTFVHYYDGQMKQQSSAPIGRTLANFFLRADIGFTKDLRIEKVQRDAGQRLHITLTQEKDPLSGAITLVFNSHDKGGLSLAGWRVLDPQNLTTDIALEEIETGIRLENDQFHYYDPKHQKPRYN